MHKFIIAALAILTTTASTHSLVGQIKVSSIALPANLQSGPQWEKDQYQIETAISIARETAKRHNRNVTVLLDSGKLKQVSGNELSYKYEHKMYRLRRPILVPGGVVLVGEGYGKREARLVWEDCQSNSALLIFRNGFGGGLRNVDIRVIEKLSDKVNVTAIYVHSQSSAIFENFAVDFRGLGSNSNGLVVNRNNTNTESVIFRDFNIAASRPVIIMSGDNLTFSNFDCTCVGEVKDDSISAVFQNFGGNVPANWTIGPGTGQKGDHAFALTGTTKRSGDALTILGYRWEQGTTKGPAWLFDVDHRFRHKPEWRAHFVESITMINCRNSPQKDNSDYVSIKLPDDSYINFNLIGGYLPGKKEIGQKQIPGRNKSARK